MNSTTPTGDKAADRTVLALKRRMDDLRVRAHLAGMDAQDALEALAKEIDALARKTTQATQELAHKLHEKIDQLEALIVRD
jgi:hypothetical protein